ncbi:uncharacterized protein V3H82_027563 isoform 3-T3 [Fundulus diaphanus]
MFVFFLLLLQIPAESRDLTLYFTIRAGDDVTLPCENVPHGYSDCSSTTWLHSNSGRAAVEIVAHGQVKDGRSDRLSVSADCSLVLKKVTAEDVGLYICRQFISGPQSGPDAQVRLSLVNLREDQNQNMVTLTCSVLTDRRCKHRVKWLYNSNDVDKENQDIKESSSSCSADVSFQTSHYVYPSRFNIFSCEVKTEDERLLYFTFNSRPSATPTPVTPKLGKTPDDSNTGPPWLYITLSLVLVALIITVVVFVLLRRTKGHKTEHKSGEGDTHRAPGTQSACENQQREADAENGVSYASISYTKKHNSRSQVKSDGDDDTVTYSTVKASSTDTNCLYASVNEPNNPV